MDTKTDARKLDGIQAARIWALIIGMLLDQLKLPFYLLTRETVSRLIELEHCITVLSTTVDR